MSSQDNSEQLYGVATKYLRQLVRGGKIIGVTIFLGSASWLAVVLGSLRSDQLTPLHEASVAILGLTFAIAFSFGVVAPIDAALRFHEKIKLLDLRLRALEAKLAKLHVGPEEEEKAMDPIIHGSQGPESASDIEREGNGHTGKSR